MNKIFIIAEAGANHNGSFDLAIELYDAAKTAKDDAIKIQIWNTDLIITNRASQATYHESNIGSEINQCQIVCDELIMQWETKNPIDSMLRNGKL